MKQLAKLTDEMAKELEKLQKEQDLLNEKLGGKLDELAKRLAAGRRQFDEQATKPLEYSRPCSRCWPTRSGSCMLALWQQDLAERLASLKGRDGEDNPR